MESINIHQLAKQMYSRKGSGDKPYLLLLGAGVSISSGVSGMNEMIDRFLIDFGVVNIDTLEEMDRDERFEKFTFEMENLNEIDRYSWLKASFENRKPSAGYVELTRLIEEGYFEVIFTTNWDSFLDISLDESNKLKSKRDFRFYVRGVDQDDFITQSFQRFLTPRIKILKLHGELDSGNIFVTPKQTAYFSKEINELLKDFLKTRDLIMIGSSISDSDVQKCIQSNQNTIIYINPKTPSDQLLHSFISNYKTFQQIVGPDAEFNNFFNKLSDALSEEERKAELEKQLAEAAFLASAIGLSEEERKAELEKRPKKTPLVFLSYARDDTELAERMYNELNQRGVNVWFDKKSLLPGQDWKKAIIQAIRDSRFFLALLSTKSVEKKGFVHREIREALEVLDQFPDHKIFIIPARLNDCVPSHKKLHRLQWVDLFLSWEEGINRIMLSIQSQ